MGIFNISGIKVELYHYLYTAEVISVFSEIYWKFEKNLERIYKKKPVTEKHALLHMTNNLG